MERFIMDDFDFTLGIDALISRLKLEEHDDIELVSGLFEQARTVARPKALCRASYIDGIDGDNVAVDGARFLSARLARNLEGIHRVFAYIVTCGAELDEWAARETDYIVSVWLDVLKEMIMGDARVQFVERIKRRYMVEKLSSMSPGSGNLDTWPLAEQRKLFALLDPVYDDIGVRLTDSLLMVPSKTVSGILFPSDTGYINCAVCERANCVGRKAEYDPQLAIGRS